MSGHTHWVTRVAQRSAGPGRGWAKALCLVAVVGAVLSAALALAVPSALAASPTGTVNLGQASTYAVLSSAAVANTVSGPPFTTLHGDLGVGGVLSGFPPGIVTGATQTGSAVAPAETDLGTAYNEVLNRPAGTPLVVSAATPVTLSPGLYTSAAAVAITAAGGVTLDAGGDPNAIFVFQVGGALTLAAGAEVNLTGGAQASHVFWQVNGAATLGANATFSGTIMATAAIGVGAGAEVNGRALSLNGAIGLNDNQIYSAPPVVAITGGASADVNTSSPTISGTTDVEAPGVVTVTIAGQTLTATPSGDAWSVPAGMLANGTYPVTASVIDGAGNTGNATQQLTIDTVPPALTMDGGSAVTTNDPTPKISGTSDVAPGTLVLVTVDSQTVKAVVQTTQTWNVAVAPLADGTHTVTAVVTDPAGNVTTASQLVTIDTVAPAVTIDGGANALTDDATPTISGTADVAPGTPVTVNLADQTLTGLVQPGGTWSVTAAALADGTHRIIMSVSDEAGNMASFTQILTVDTVAPDITIAGGATATTNNLDPTIAGTSNAAPGTTVTVSIAGQTMTTLLQTNGTWNVTPNAAVGDGSWTVLASDADPAGNVGSAKQHLTISKAGSSGTGSGSGSGSGGSGSGGSGSGGSGGSGSGSGGSGSGSGSGGSGAGGAGPGTQMTVSVACPAADAKRCRGSVSAISRVTTAGGKPVKVIAAGMRAASKQRQSKQATTVVQVASGSYSVATGQDAKITLKLNKHGKQLLDRFYRVPATLKIAGAISASRTITFSYTRVRAGISAKWTATSSSTSLDSLTVSRLPGKSTVTVTCHGGGCSFATHAFSPTTTSLTLPAEVGNAKLKPGATLQVTVSVAGQVGEVARFAVRSGQSPSQTSLCLVPEARVATVCAAA
jgi:Ice-binding-like/Bacterial Ig-like domain